MEVVYHYCAMTTLPTGGMSYRDGYHRVTDGHFDIDKLRTEVAATFNPPKEPHQVVFLSMAKLS